jgi:catechol 2,3-dioxygenase-like lactoylglutathione lyase family enzyme
MTALSHLFIHVSDLSRTRQFYVGQLGLSVLAEENGYLRIGGDNGFHMGVEERGPAEIGAAGIEIVIRVDDVDSVFEHLSADGVRFVSPPQDMPWGMRHAWLTDPDGYHLSIYT